MTKWWEKEPVRFECQSDCFKCCVKPGIVHFDRKDIRNAADFLQTSPAEFKKTYLIRDEGEWVLEVGEEWRTLYFFDRSGLQHPRRQTKAMLILSVLAGEYGLQVHVAVGWWILSLASILARWCL